jgi:hypothetical protein
VGFAVEQALADGLARAEAAVLPFVCQLAFAGAFVGLVDTAAAAAEIPHEEGQP